MKVIETLKKIDKKTYIYIGVAVLVIVAIILIIRKLTKKEEAEETLEDFENHINNSNIDHDFSYTDTQYGIFADSIESSLSDKGISAGLLGVNQKGVYSVFEKMKTDDDIEKLVVAFGTREFRKAYTLKTQKCTLPQALSLLMTTGEIENINEILSGNNINYQF